MISLIQYDEFGKNMDLPSIKDSFNKGKYDGQSKIIDYLKKGKVTAVSMGKVFDVFTGKEIMHENKLMNDGMFSWTSALIYYVENYNLRLPEEFEKHVLNSPLPRIASFTVMIPEMKVEQCERGLLNFDE